MYKTFLAFILLYLAACSELPAKSLTHKQEEQRDSFKQIISLSQQGTGFVSTEAKQLLEFCIEPNNQDDRNNPNKKSVSQYQAKPTGWKIVYDSRHPGNAEWNKSWAWKEGNPDDDPNNPLVNGFGPFNNAWLLVQSETYPSKYAITVRGTVGEINSILADAFATTTPAYAGIQDIAKGVLPITFVATPKAEIHIGFAYLAYTLLFDKQKGILARLHQLNLPDNCTLFITGHSQGAAVATLLHSFLFYAITDPNDRYHLNLKLNTNSQKPGRMVRLKSYLFAQPKPGNQQYAQDYARITKGMSFAVNNDRDPIPQVPLSLQVIAEVSRYVEEDNKGKGNPLEKLTTINTHIINETIFKVRDHFAKKGVDLVAKKFATIRADLALDKYFQPSDSPIPAKAISLNYTLAGELVPLFGLLQGGDEYPIGKDQDLLLQHHATTYRELIKQ
jgi:Lipase (class 3)